MKNKSKNYAKSAFANSAFTISNVIFLSRKYLSFLKSNFTFKKEITFQKVFFFKTYFNLQYGSCDIHYEEEFSFLYVIWTFVDEDDDFQLLDPRVRARG